MLRSPSVVDTVRDSSRQVPNTTASRIVPVASMT